MDFLKENEKNNKKIIITGGTEGIGRIIAENLLKTGSEIAVCARTQKKLDDLKNNYPNVLIKKLDLADGNNAVNFIKESILEMNGIDILILNAGITGLKESEDYVFKVNELANVVLIENAIEALRKSNGVVVFMTSGTAHTKLEGGIRAYRESKLHIEKLLEELSKKSENENVLFFSVNPGSVKTRMHKIVVDYGGDDIRNRTLEKISNNQLRDPEIIGRIISKMCLLRNKFNIESKNYDISIKSGDVVEINDENIIFENDKK